MLFIVREISGKEVVFGVVGKTFGVNSVLFERLSWELDEIVGLKVISN